MLGLRGRGGRLWPERVRQLVAAVEQSQNVLFAEIDVCIVDAPQMAHLHQTYCALPGPTDVLSFDLGTSEQSPSPAGPGRRGRLPRCGQIVVCRDVAREQALSRGHGVQAELLLYVLHGLLHLSGLDDRTPADFQRIHAIEDQILATLDWPVRFSTPPRSPAARHPAPSQPSEASQTKRPAPPRS